MTQTAREYLVGLGLAKAGARGKFSADAHKALKKALADGVKFSDWNEQGRITVSPDQKIRHVRVPSTAVKAPLVLRTQKPLRDATVMRITEPSGMVTVLDVHLGSGACNKPIKFCTCRNITAPSYFGTDAKVVLE